MKNLPIKKRRRRPGKCLMAVRDQEGLQEDRAQAYLYRPIAHRIPSTASTTNYTRRNIFRLVGRAKLEKKWMCFHP
jgi:hypothetical protein